MPEYYFQQDGTPLQTYSASEIEAVVRAQRPMRYDLLNYTRCERRRL